MQGPVSVPQAGRSLAPPEHFKCGTAAAPSGLTRGRRGRGVGGAGPAQVGRDVAAPGAALVPAHAVSRLWVWGMGSGHSGLAPPGLGVQSRLKPTVYSWWKRGSGAQPNAKSRRRAMEARESPRPRNLTSAFPLPRVCRMPHFSLPTAVRVRLASPTSQMTVAACGRAACCSGQVRQRTARLQWDLCD